jgi:hypothetical protein
MARRFDRPWTRVMTRTTPPPPLHPRFIGGSGFLQARFTGASAKLHRRFIADAGSTG